MDALVPDEGSSCTLMPSKFECPPGKEIACLVAEFTCVLESEPSFPILTCLCHKQAGMYFYALEYRERRISYDGAPFDKTAD